MTRWEKVVGRVYWKPLYSSSLPRSFSDQILQWDVQCLSDFRSSALVADEYKKAASRRHVPTGPRGKAAHASSHWPRDLDPDYARYRRVCWSVWQGSSMLQRELLREAEEMRAERQDVLPPSRAHDPAWARQLSGHPSAVQRLQRLLLWRASSVQDGQSWPLVLQR